MKNNLNDSWTANWAMEKLETHDKVQLIKVISPNLISIMIDGGKKFLVATISAKQIEVDDIDLGQEIDFLLNLNTDPYYSKWVLDYSNMNNFSIGGLGDLMRGLNEGNLKNYTNPEILFIERGLRQHTKVTTVSRLDNRRFSVERLGLPTVIILALNDYDLTADTVRTAIDKYPKFDAILKSNPNCRSSTNSIGAATLSGIKLLSWGELMSGLNKKW